MREPSRVRVTGPLEPFADGFIAELEAAGYRPAAAVVQVRVLAHLSRWMQDEDVSPGGWASVSWSGSVGSISLGSRACAALG